MAIKFWYLVFAAIVLGFQIHYGDYAGAMVTTMMGFIVAGA